jgi:hypothetical protein
MWGIWRKFSRPKNRSVVETEWALRGTANDLGKGLLNCLKVFHNAICNVGMGRHRTGLIAFAQVRRHFSCLRKPIEIDKLLNLNGKLNHSNHKQLKMRSYIDDQVMSRALQLHHLLQ